MCLPRLVWLLVLIIEVGIVFKVPTYSQAQQLPKNEYFGFYLLKKRKFTKIPFEIHANLIVVKLQINESDTLQFILDTGVSNTIITDPSVKHWARERFGRSVEIEGVGNQGSVKANVSIGNTLTVNGQARIMNHNLIVLDQDILLLSEVLGTPVHGILGYDFFERFAVTLDFQRKLIMLEMADTYRYRKYKGQRLPITIENRKPYIDSVLIASRNTKQYVRLLIDTGAGHALLLNSWATGVLVPEKTVQVQLGVGLSGLITGQLGRLERVQFGKISIPNMLVSFPDSASYDSKLAQTSSLRQGNIGGELLKRFTITFNYRDEYVVMKPVRRMLKDPFEHDMSGIDLRAKGPDYTTYRIENIILESPAYYAGLVPGDEILFINNNPVRELNLTAIYKLLQRKEGREIKLIVKRDGGIEFVSFKLRRII